MSLFKKGISKQANQKIQILKYEDKNQDNKGLSGNIMKLKFMQKKKEKGLDEKKLEEANEPSNEFIPLKQEVWMMNGILKNMKIKSSKMIFLHNNVVKSSKEILMEEQEPDQYKRQYNKIQ